VWHAASGGGAHQHLDSLGLLIECGRPYLGQSLLGTRLRWAHLDDLGIPGFDQDEEQNPPRKVVELKAKIRAADAILLVTPEYNYGMPGALKIAIDWASRPYGDSAWNGKPVAIMSAALSIGRHIFELTCR
jgi:NAD(P)H-dependent FMN reductase